MTPAENLTNSEIIEHLERLRSAPYYKLSRIHAEWLAELEMEASLRKLKIPTP